MMHAFIYNVLIALPHLLSGSTVSLGMGLLFGSLSAAGAYQTSQNPQNYGLLLGN